MFEQVWSHIQAKVRALEYVVTIHADEEMDNDGLSIFDVEQVILAGQIVERQQDRQTQEWKYLIKGQTNDLLNVIVVVKCSATAMVIIITVY